MVFRLRMEPDRLFNMYGGLAFTTVSSLHELSPLWIFGFQYHITLPHWTYGLLFIMFKHPSAL